MDRSNSTNQSINQSIVHRDRVAVVSDGGLGVVPGRPDDGDDVDAEAPVDPAESSRGENGEAAHALAFGGRDGVFAFPGFTATGLHFDKDDRAPLLRRIFHDEVDLAAGEGDVAVKESIALAPKVTGRELFARAAESAARAPTTELREMDEPGEAGDEMSKAEA